MQLKNSSFLLDPDFRLENDVFGDEGNSLSELSYEPDTMSARSAPALPEDAYTLYYPPERRWAIHTPQNHTHTKYYTCIYVIAFILLFLFFSFFFSLLFFLFLFFVIKVIMHVDAQLQQSDRQTDRQTRQTDRYRIRRQIDWLKEEDSSVWFFIVWLAWNKIGNAKRNTVVWCFLFLLTLVCVFGVLSQSRNACRRIVR